MAITLNIQNTIKFAQPILKNQNIDVSNGEPALSIGNIILQRMLAPPFRWPFNRNTFQFQTVSTTPPTTDYTVTLNDFRFLEDVWLVDSLGNIHAVEIKISLAPDTNVGRPNIISVQNDDNEGDITFRLSVAPNAVYTISGVYQKKATLMTSLAANWGVFSDEFSFIFNLGFLTLACLLVNDARFPIFEKWFVGSLLGVQDGLSDQERAIFLGEWMNLTRTVSRTQSLVQQGAQGRGQ